MVKQFFQGICMALADSVPGVSGGTIAFILGFYDRFIGSINDLIFERGQKRKEAFIYLVKLGIGWSVGMIGAVLVLSQAFESHIYLVSSLFLGFVLASIPFVVRQEMKGFYKEPKNILYIVSGILVVWAITKLNQISFLDGAKMDALSIPLAIYIFIAGMIAICAMFLPGISGSTLLLIFGLYLPIIDGIKEFLHLNFAVFPGLFIFGLGVLTGAASVVKGIKKCLDNYRMQTMCTILGLMIGSLYAIIMGPTTLDTPVAQLGFSNFHVIAFLIGGALVTILQIVGSRLEGKENTK